MDTPKDIRKAKLDMWRKKLEQLETEYAAVMVIRGEAMAMGDLRENAAFQMADEDASTYNVRIEEVRKILAKIEAEEEDERRKK